MESFLQTLFPGIARVCGRDLPPLTLWRLACLQAVRSPFLDPQASWTLKDLLIALRAVSTANLTPPEMEQSIEDVWILTRRGQNRAYLEKEAAAFIAWLSLHQLRPELWQPEGELAAQMRTLSAPPILSTVAALMELGMTHAEAWDTAPGYATWLISAAAERHSDAVQFGNPEEDAAIEAMLSDLEARDEAAILAQAKADLPPAVFEKWCAARAARGMTKSE